MVGGYWEEERWVRVVCRLMMGSREGNRGGDGSVKELVWRVFVFLRFVIDFVDSIFMSFP